MSANYAAHFNTRQTQQTQPMPGKEQVKNNAGGFVFKVSQWDQMLRFLILGAEGGTYYSTEQKLTAANAANTVKCIQEDPQRAVDLILDVSQKGRAAKQDATIFALALACTFAPEKTRPIAYKAISSVCRTGTHLFTFVSYIKSMRGWSRGLRTGVANFYSHRNDKSLELQIVKYRNREGFTHRDVLRLAHPSIKDPKVNTLLKYTVGKLEGEESKEEYQSLVKNFPLVGAYEEAKKLDPKNAADLRQMVNMITDTGLPREGVPTNFLNQTEVWDAMLVNMPVMALVRNLGKMSSLGMTKSNLSAATLQIVTKLKDPQQITRSRIHPMAILTALKVYSKGAGEKGSLTWTPNAKIIDALNDAFYLAFGNVEANGLNNMECLDVSGSMGMHFCAGSPVVDCRTAAAAMAMISLRVEQNSDIIGFTSDGKNFFGGNGTGYAGRENGVSQLAISANQRLDDVVKYMSLLRFGGTDCSLPMIYAEKNKIPVDVFKVYTDNETYAGTIHPKQALDSYRQKMGRDAKLVVIAMTASPFSIADSTDKGMLDVVGFDTATPGLITEFAKGFLA